MGIRSRLVIFALIFIDVGVGMFLLLHNKNIAVLNPAGTVALQEKNVILLVGAFGLSLVGVVVLLTFFIAWKYRAGNIKTSYEPEWNHSLKFEILRWGLLCMVIGLLAVFTWYTAHLINPWNPLPSDTKPVTIQVVALQWRWLFIYPDHKIATINYMVVPQKTPINLELTADAPMSSFWVPSLVGQMYAMTGMSTKNHMITDRMGEFQGLNAEISGEGFAQMKFTVKSTTEGDFNAWVEDVRRSSQVLTPHEYDVLAKPSTDSTVRYYTVGDSSLYNSIVMKFMKPPSEISQGGAKKNKQMPGMKM